MPCSIIDRFRDLRPEADTIFSRKHSGKKSRGLFVIDTASTGSLCKAAKNG